MPELSLDGAESMNWESPIHEFYIYPLLILSYANNFLVKQMREHTGYSHLLQVSPKTWRWKSRNFTSPQWESLKSCKFHYLVPHSLQCANPWVRHLALSALLYGFIWFWPPSLVLAISRLFNCVPNSHCSRWRLLRCLHRKKAPSMQTQQNPFPKV